MERIKNWFKKDHLNLIVGGLLTVIVILATFLRFYHIGKLSFWYDEIDTFIFATHNLKVVFKNSPNMLLYYLLANYWIRIFPHASEALLRSISAIFSVASIPVVFLLGRKFGTNRKQAAAIGLMAAFFVTLNAFHIQYAQEFRSYSLVFLLTSLSTYLLIKAIEQPDSYRYWVWYTIISVAAVYSHFHVVFLIAAQAVTLLVLLLDRKKHSFPLREILCSSVAIALLICPIALAAHAAGASQIGWITKPTFKNVVNFAIEITGNQGVLLFAFYLLAVGVGFLVGVRACFQKDVITKWKFALVASCLFLPVFMALLVSRVMIPIFVDRYLLFIMPYTAILAAIGIITLVSPDWDNRNVAVITIPIGIVLLAIIVIMSAEGVKTYFELFQKEDWRGASQYLADECPTSLRLYYMVFIENDGVYYNTNLKSQVVGWSKFLNKNPNSEKIARFLPSGYSQACLVLGHVHSQNYNEQKNIQSALKFLFPKVTKINKFYGVNIEIYSK